MATVSPRARGQKKVKRRKAPKNAAVVLTCIEGGYAECLRLAREQINLADLDIEVMKPRRALTGALILEVPGPNSEAKADQLAIRMREVLAGKEGTKITRPKKTAEIRLRDLDDSISKAEILNAVTRQVNARVTTLAWGRSPARLVGYTLFGLNARWLQQTSSWDWATFKSGGPE